MLCTAKTAKGTPCRNQAREGSEFCGIHDPETVVGRPTKYVKGKYDALVEAHAAGPKTDAQIADAMDVAYSNFRVWLKKHKSFQAAHKRGRDQLLDDTEMSTYRRANGYEYVEVDVTVEEFISCRPGSVKKAAYQDALDARTDGESVYQIKRTTKHKQMAPDVGAISIVLFNRRKPGYDPDNPEKGWQSVTKIEHSGSIDNVVQVVRDDIPRHGD